jgi:hypothetical protein
MSEKFSIDEKVYRAYADAAKRNGLSTEELINDALRDWLRDYEEDVKVAEERLREFEKTGDGVDIETVIRQRG